jgi:outer membrane lipoprotein-sorting protein
MDSKKKAWTAAVAGTTLGVAGLAVIAMPAGAGESPQLPAVSADDLVQSVLTARTPALGGTVKVENNLGLPTAVLPGVGALPDSARVYNDGNGHSRLALQQGTNEETIVHDGATVWDYRSSDNSARKFTVPAEIPEQARDGAAPQLSDPAKAGTQLLAKVRETSTVTVEGTARVAGRTAYELVLTPKPAERTLLREVRVTVDSETRTPLRFAVLTQGTADPALQIAFSDIQFTQQPAELFRFSPPAGAKVTEQQPKADQQAVDKAKQVAGSTKVVGDGWDTVLTGSIPAGALNSQPNAGKGEGRGSDPKALLARFGKRVTGAWGSGYLITTKVGTAVVTDDNRFAAGAVPEQVLYQALGAR